jgi:hypothetical protein
MKKLSVEEKAKRYDEALKYARIYYTDGNEDMKMMMKTCFPVLVEESEDERIRKDIIWCLKHSGIKESNPINPHVTTTAKDAISWLEKQCRLMKALQISNSRIAELVEEKYNLEENLEKQGEQKPDEPKFKVGDWVISTLPGIKYPHLITDIQDGYYIFGEDDDHAHIASSDDIFKLWTIDNAKEGDVLFDGSNILLVKEVNHWHNVTSYLAYSQVYNIREYFISGSDVIIPATKEQRDLLFQKMKEAGYEWDEEKKELKKIDKPTKWSEEDEKIRKVLIDYLTIVKDEENGSTTFYGIQIDDIIAWLEKQGCKQTMIDKACEWLKEHLIDYWSQKVTDPTEFINELKKAMEE